MKKYNAQKGKLGETIARKYLEKLGYKIVETNYHYSKNAEIDIIALDKKTLVFVEVKSRSDLSFGHPFEAITRAKLQKIRTAIYGYLSNNEVKYKEFRFDAIAITGFDNPKIEHLKDVGKY